MSLETEIVQAVGAHGLWKQRLKNAVASGKSELSPAQAEADHLCAFGIWLRDLTGPVAHSEYYSRVRSLHSAFHKEAGKVLQLALAGSKTEASQALAHHGPFALASAALTRAMMSWKKEVGGAG